MCSANLKDNDLIFEAYYLNSKLNINELFDYFGGDSEKLMSGGLYPGIKGKEAVQNMIFDIYNEDYFENFKDSNRKEIAILFSIEKLTDEQLLKLIMYNYSGSPLNEMPESVRVFSKDKTWFEPNAPDNEIRILKNAVTYYYFDPSSLNSELPSFAQKRNNALELRNALFSVIKNWHKDK